MDVIKNSLDEERERLREANGFHELVQQTTDSITLKPVRPKTERLYNYVLHEWDLYVSPRRTDVHKDRL
jgi:hypothetical protein